MQAFSAAKRITLTVLCFSFLMAVPLAFAAEEQSGYLGVMLQEISPSMAKALQLGEKSGVMISEVVDDSPADKAGLQDGDVIVEFQGQAVSDTQAFTKAVRQAKPGEKVEMVILHNGKEQTLWVDLGERKNDLTWFNEDGNQVLMLKGEGDKDIQIKMLKDLHEGMPGGHEVIIKRMIDGDEDLSYFDTDRGFLGVSLDDIQGQMAEYFEVEDGKGVLVTEVTGDSPAAKAGLKAGDVIVSLGGESVATSGELHKVMASTKPGQEIDVKFIRKGKTKDLKVTLGEFPEGMMMKNIQVITDDDNFSIHAPKMLFHGQGSPHASGKMEWIQEKDELDQLRQELKQMQMELQEMKKELKK